jgi:hypothetical protein
VRDADHGYYVVYAGPYGTTWHADPDEAAVYTRSEAERIAEREQFYEPVLEQVET